jgi:hypothetical protein
MNEKSPPKVSSKWAAGKRRELTEETAKKSGYPSNLREEGGWRNGARLRKK